MWKREGFVELFAVGVAVLILGIGVLAALDFRPFSQTKAIPIVKVAATSTPLVVKGSAPAASSTSLQASSTSSSSTLIAAPVPVPLPDSFVVMNPTSTSFTYATSSLSGVTFYIKQLVEAGGGIVLRNACAYASYFTSTDAQFVNDNASSSNACFGAPTVGLFDGQAGLVTVDIDIVNNSGNQVTFAGPLELFYTEKVEGQDTTRLAPIYLPITTAVVTAFSDKVIRTGFLVPQDQNIFELTYGYVGTPVQMDENFFGQAQGSFTVDFGKRLIFVTPG